MIERMLQYVSEPDTGPEFLEAIGTLLATARQGNPEWVEKAELAVRDDPTKAFSFDEYGFATLTVNDHSWHAGRFETPSIAELRHRVKQVSNHQGKLRLWVLDGRSPVTDIGGLQATATPGSLFQAASQFNCLESPGSYVTPVVQYFRDWTQGPRASISAFPGTLLRHYRAPGTDGSHFVQTDEDQLNLLADVFSAEVASVQSGYMMSQNIRDSHAFLVALTDNFETIRVGVHEGVQVVLGYDFEGSVTNSEQRRIAQVFTSTFADGGYSRGRLTKDEIELTCRQLLRGAYLGTLLSAVALKQSRVVLTLIGGGVFGNPIPLIWESILWAVSETESVLSNDLDVIINGRDITNFLSRECILTEVQNRDGALLCFPPSGLPEVYH